MLRNSQLEMGSIIAIMTVRPAYVNKVADKVREQVERLIGGEVKILDSKDDGMSLILCVFPANESVIQGLTDIHIHGHFMDMISTLHLYNAFLRSSTLPLPPTNEPTN